LSGASASGKYKTNPFANLYHIVVFFVIVYGRLVHIVVFLVIEYGRVIHIVVFFAIVYGRVADIVGLYFERFFSPAAAYASTGNG
jgi:hypothetical protein